jgi:hypothetical protein
VFVTSPSVQPAGHDLRLVRTARRTFTGPASFLADPENLPLVSEYLADMTGGSSAQMADSLTGQEYGEMAEELIGLIVPADEPVDLLVLAFAVHDVRPGRPTAAYLSHRTPGAPLAFAICDQGSAAAFSALQVARAYAATAGVRRALVIVVEQAELPYRCPAPVPVRHQGIAMLYAASPGEDARIPFGDTRGLRLADVRQHAGVAAGEVAGLAAADLAALAAGRRAVTLVLDEALAAQWTPGSDASRVLVAGSGQPSTALWWSLIDEAADPADLLVAAGYDAGLGYLCLSAFAG